MEHPDKVLYSSDSSKALLLLPREEVVATKLLQALQEQMNQSKMTMRERERWEEIGSITILRRMV
jgi:hypothetical protein